MVHKKINRASREILDELGIPPSTGDSSMDIDSGVDSEECYHGAVKDGMAKHPSSGATKYTSGKVAAEDSPDGLTETVARSTSWAESILSRNSARASQIMQEAQNRNIGKLSGVIDKVAEEAKETLDTTINDASKTKNKAAAKKEDTKRTAPTTPTGDAEDSWNTVTDQDYIRFSEHRKSNDQETRPEYSSSSFDGTAVFKVFKILVSIAITVALVLIGFRTIPNLVENAVTSLSGYATSDNSIVTDGGNNSEDINTEEPIDTTPDSQQSTGRVIGVTPPEPYEPEEESNTSDTDDTKKVIGVTHPESTYNTDEEKEQGDVITVPDSSYEQVTMIFVIDKKESNLVGRYIWVRNDSVTPSVTKMKASSELYNSYDVDDLILIDCWVNDSGKVKFSAD